MVTKEYIVPLYYLNATTLSVKMRDFCGLFPVMKVASFDSKKDMEANFFSLMTSKSNLFNNFLVTYIMFILLFVSKRDILKN